MLIKYSVTFLGELKLSDDLSDDEIVEIIEENIYDRTLNDIEWEEIN